MPAASWRTLPARSIRRWETISASLGVSRRIGKKYRESRMCSVHRFELRLAPFSETGSPRKTQERQKIQQVFACGLSSRRGKSAPLPDHGAVHDNPDDNLDLFEYI